MRKLQTNKGRVIRMHEVDRICFIEVEGNDFGFLSGINLDEIDLKLLMYFVDATYSMFDHQRTIRLTADSFRKIDKG